MKLKQRIIAILMTIILVGTNLITLGNEVKAAEIFEQNNKTNVANVTFDSYLEESKKSKTYEIGKEASIYFKLNVQKSGYLKNIVIKVEEDANYSMQNPNNDKVQSYDENQINLKQIATNETVEVKVPITLKMKEQIENNYLSKTSNVTLSAIYVDANGKEKEVKKTIQNQVIWEAKSAIEANFKNLKFVPYKENEKSGVMVQTLINVNLEKNNLPVANTNLTINVPSLNNIKPEKATVIANKTIATNGDELGLNFTSENYIYNKELAKLAITTKNENLSWKQNSTDEYIVTLFYIGDEAYNYAISNGMKAQMPVKVVINTVNEVKVEKEFTVNYDLKEQKGSLIDVNLEAQKEISKGYIYANYEKTAKQQAGKVIEKKEQTPYEVIYNIPVVDKTIANNISFQTVKPVYVDNNNKQYSMENNSKINSIKILSENFNKMLGQEGNIEVSDEAGKLIGKINKSTSKDEQNNYVLNISKSNVNTVKIKTTNPVSEGTLRIIIENALVEGQTYTLEQMKTFKEVKLENVAIKLQEPVSKAEFSITGDNKILSTAIEEDQEIELRAVLDTSSVYNSLYKDPTLEFAMPKQVEKVNIKDVNLLLEDELDLKETKVVEKDGKQVIQIALEGTQTEYFDKAVNNKQENVITKGANIITTANVKLDKSATSSSEQIQMTYTNSGTTTTQTYQEKADISIVAPNGVTTETIVESDGIKVEANNNEMKTINMEANTNKKTLQVSNTVTNNNNNNIENVIILGKLPVKDTVLMQGTQNYTNTFTSPLVSNITATSGSNNIKVYYSENANATAEILNSSNGWQENVSDYSKVKSYLIVVSGEIAKSGKITFNYQIEVPENVAKENKTYQNYQVFYDNKLASATVGDVTNSGIIKIETAQKTHLEATLSANIAQNQKVSEDQIVTFEVTVKNTGKALAENVEVLVPVPTGTVYTTYNAEEQLYVESTETNVKLSIGSIEPEKTKSVNYTLKMGKEGLGVFQNQITVNAKDLETPVTSNTYALEKIEAKVNLTLVIPRNPEDVLVKNDILYTTVLIEPQTEINNAAVSIDIPNGITVKEAKYLDSNLAEKSYITTANGKVTANIPKLTLGNSESIKLQLQIEEITGNFNLQAIATASGMEKTNSNVLTYHVGSPKLEIIQSSTDSKYVKEAEEITYTFTIKNTGDSNASDVVFENKLPEGLTFEKLSYTYQGKTEGLTACLDNTAKVRWTSFEKGATATIKVTAKADLLPEDKQDKGVSNSAVIYAKSLEKVGSNAITTIIEYNSKLYEDVNGGSGSQEGNGSQDGSDNQGNEGSAANQGNSSNNGTGNNQGSSSNNGTGSNGNQQGNNQTGSYKITGTAWLDENKNGNREENEKVLPNIEVILLRKQTSEVVKDLITGEEQIVKTDSNGAYQFNNLIKDEYLVIFVYDAGLYSITEYQAKDVSKSYNSDAISMPITLNGKQVNAGVTDTIKIENDNQRDIDIGLYVAKKFDLKLEKTISKITLTTPTIGTKVYNYEDTQLTKIEVLKQNLGKSNIVVEYKIKVTNEGQVAGYAKKIIDYLPNDVTFNSELNKEWYASDNNQTVYNTSMANTLLDPGESCDVSLILSLNITEKNVGNIINNNAEIYESYNEQGLEDIDSTPANKLETEDDMSKADIVLGVVTGTIVVYSGLGISILFIITLGVIIAKRILVAKKIEKYEE